MLDGCDFVGANLENWLWYDSTVIFSSLVDRVN
jgi:hypothetical protein